MTDFYKSVLNSRHLCQYNNISEETFMNASNNIFRNISNDEIKNIYQMFAEDMKSGSTSNVFNLLYKYGEKVLSYYNKVPVCRYEYLLNWWKSSNKIGQDLITMAYMAKVDILNGSHSISFSYPAVINNDNDRLNSILDKGLAENHFHLNGSTATFPLSWAYLMNHFNKINEKTDPYFKDLLDKDTYGIDKTIKWSFFIKLAAMIRVWLFNSLINGNSTDNYMEIIDDDCIEHYCSSKFLKFIKRDLLLNEDMAASAIGRTRYLHGVKDAKTGEVLDYASPIEYSKNHVEITALTGERFVLYECFRKVYLNEFDDIKMQLFYFYLVIKSAFRGEMIQSNDRSGFNNFSLYQDRKDVIYSSDRLYERCADILAVNSSFETQNIKYLEARIAPKNTTEKLIRSIYEKDNHIFNSSRIAIPDTKMSDNADTLSINTNNFYYVIHFIKQTDKPLNKSNPFSFNISCRNYACRQKVHTQAEALYKALNEKNSLRSRIYGIDAASTEIGCRPEVMAVDFRRLKYMIPSYEHCKFIKENPLIINTTYHIGEDFYDIIDGLRAIDEAVLFLNLRRNDRLGHALALGTDPMCYYQKRNFTAVMSKQDMLDNLIWFIYKADNVNAEILASDKQKILNKIYSLFSDIYTDSHSSFDFCDYINSWKLRGDHPYLYRFGIFDYEPQVYFNSYKSACINKSVDNTIRKNNAATELYSDYHFNKKVRKTGAEQTDFTFTQTMMNTLSQIQHSMQINIASQGISIECNPTSNYVIGDFKRFEKHPILSFYNNHLENQNQHSAQISVSINTDDQGVFDTNLKNEYSVMASALEQITDKTGEPSYSPDNVYHWLDEVRQMGISQSFGNSRSRYK